MSEIFESTLDQMNDNMLSYFIISYLKALLTFIKTTFALQDDSMVSDKIILVLSDRLFSNILSLPIICLLIFAIGQASSFYQAKATKFYFQPTNKLFAELLKNSKLNSMRYKPWTYAFNGHWQAFLFPAIETAHQLLNKTKLINEVYTLSDGGKILLDWYLNPRVSYENDDDSSNDDGEIEKQYKRRNPLIIVVPGLTGDSRNLYVISTLKEAEKHGYDAVIVNYRCQAGLKPTSPHIYHAANTSDLQEAIDWIREMRNESLLFAVGISLGAGIVTNYVAKCKYDCPLKAAVAVGCHYDSEISLKHMSSYWFGIYDFILGFYTKIVNQETIRIIDELNQKTNPDRIIGDELSKIYQLTHFIEKIITKIEGIKSFQEYILESSCTHRLQDVKIPLFFISANDDPVFGNKCIPIDKCHENILIGVTKAGGHLGYFEGFVLPHKQWFPEPTFEFINFIHQQVKSQDQESSTSMLSDKIVRELKRANSIQLVRRQKSDSQVDLMIN